MSFQTPRMGKNVNPCWDEGATVSVVPRPGGCLGAAGPTAGNTAGSQSHHSLWTPEVGWGDLGVTVDVLCLPKGKSWWSGNRS